MKLTTTILVLLIATSNGLLAEANHQPYKGLEARDIASLSEDDLVELGKGAGWGLALPAELNGYPGPTHVLDFGEQLGLTRDQRQQVQAIFEEMRQEAIEKGVVFIEAERKIDTAFKTGRVDSASLETLIQEAEAARAELRLVHLSRHLSTFVVLDDEQISKYNKMRGYASNPCDSVPDGHNAELWRRHNGCEG